MQYLLVTSGGRAFGLPAEGVGEILGIDELLPAPVVRPAVRGVILVQERLVPLVHLAALLDDTAPPAGMSPTAVLVSGVGVTVALEVDETAEFVRQEPTPVPGGWDLPWAAGVARCEGSIVPIVDLDALVERLRATARAGASS